MILSAWQLKGLNKIGDAFIPGESQKELVAAKHGDRQTPFPSFSQLGCSEHSDLLLEYMPKSDVSDLKLLLLAFSVLPLWSLKTLLGLLEIFHRLPAPVGGIVRLLRVGIKGFVVSLYYSGKTGKSYGGKTPLEIIGYEVKCE